MAELVRGTRREGREVSWIGWSFVWRQNKGISDDKCQAVNRIREQRVAGQFTMGCYRYEGSFMAGTLDMEEARMRNDQRIGYGKR